MRTPSDTATVSAVELFQAVDRAERRGAISASRLTEGFLDRIRQWQPRVNALITVTPDAARRRAQVADEATAGGRDLGPTHGMVVAIKDDIDLGGVRATAGSSFFRNHVASTDAAVVRGLLGCGAIPIAKAGLSEFALGSTSDNVHFGPVRNPWDPTRYPGGSSGGPAAALAADLCVGALGSDAGGSIRIPAALCGVTGMRPTYGCISGRGSTEVAPSLETIGPMARAATDVARMFLAMGSAQSSSGRERMGRVTTGEDLDVHGLRVGLPSRFFFDDVDDEVDDAVHTFAEELGHMGATVRQVELPDPSDVIAAVKVMINTDAYAIHETRLSTHPTGYGDEVRTRMLLGRDTTGSDLARAHETCRQWTRRLNRRFLDVDLVLTPTVSFCARPIADTQMIAETALLSRLTVPFSCTTGPSLSIPCGFASGLPIGAQLVAAPGRDDLLLEVAAAYQQRTDWHRRRPAQPDSDPAPDPLRMRSLVDTQQQP